MKSVAILQMDSQGHPVAELGTYDSAQEADIALTEMANYYGGQYTILRILFVPQHIRRPTEPLPQYL